MKKLFNNQFRLVVVSIVLSTPLFLTAASSNYTRTDSQISRATETYTRTSENVLIDVKYDTNKYFTSGYSYETEVYLALVNRVELDSEINSDTRGFKVVTNLTNLGEGTQTVPLQVTDLPSGVTATTSPSSVSVIIGKKKTKTFKVQGEVDSSQLATGYELKEISTNISEVRITSSESIIDQIDHAVAKLPETEVLDSNYSGRVALQAVAADDTILASAINPSKTKLEVAVKKLARTVPVTVKTTEEVSDKISNISYKLSQSQVTISGSQDALDTVDEVVANVDIANVTKGTSISMNLSVSNMTVDPSVVTVQLTVTEK